MIFQENNHFGGNVFQLKCELEMKVENEIKKIYIGKAIVKSSF